MADATRDANVRLSADVDPYTRSMNAASVSTNQAGVSVDGLTAKLRKLEVQAAKKLLLISAGTSAGILGATTAAAAYEKRLTTLAATSAITGKSMSGFTGQIDKLTKALPLARGQAADLVTTLDGLGITSTKQIGSIADSMVRLSASTGESLGGLTTGMVELGRQLGTLTSGDMSSFANSLLTVSKNAGVSATGVLQFASAVAPASRAAGLTEKQVLGVSTAFQKAGADGFAAANSFNTILSDITRQIATGSPEIAKYANLIGVTSSQFAKMDKAEALTQIFETINRQGPDAIKTLDRLGFDGVRAQRSFQAVSQSGGLRAAIADATNAPASNLNTASDAAMNGLQDSLGKTSAQMELLTENVGKPFLETFKPVVSVFNQLLNVVNAIAAPLSTVTEKMGSFLALGTGALGGALLLSKVNGALAVAGSIARSTAVNSARGGFAVGRGNARGQTVVNQESILAAEGGQNFLQRGIYRTAVGYGQALGANAPTKRSVLSGGIRGAGALSRYLINAQTDFVQDARLSGYDRQTPIVSGIGRAATRAGSVLMNPRAFIAGLGTETSGLRAPTLTPYEQRAQAHVDLAARTGQIPDAKAVDALAKAAARSTEAFIAEAAERGRAVAGQRAQTTVGRELAATTGGVVKAFLRLEAQSAITGGKVALQGIRSAAPAAARGALSLVGGPTGLAVYGGLALGGFVKAGLDKNNETRVSDNGSSLDKYNVELGRATSELGSFAVAVKSATDNLPKAEKMADVYKISEQVVKLAKTPDRKMINEDVKSYKSTSSQAAYLQSLNLQDPKQLQLAQADLVQAFGKDQAQRAMNAFSSGGGATGQTNYAALTQQIAARQGDGVMGFLRSATGMRGDSTRNLVGSAVDDIQGRQVANSTLVNDKYANAQRNNDLVSLLSSTVTDKSVSKLSSNEGKQMNLTQAEIVKTIEDRVLGGEKLGFNMTSFGQDMKAKLGDKFDDPEAKRRYTAQYLKDRDTKGLLGADFGYTSETGLTGLKQNEESDTVKSLRSLGAVGAATIDDKKIKAAIDKPGDMNAQYEGTMKMASAANEVGKNFAGADTELQKIKATIKDVNNPLYQMADQAQRLNEALKQRELPTMSRAGRTASVMSDYRAVLAGPKDDQYPARKQAAEEQVAQDKAANYEYLKSIVVAQKSFDIQMVRMSEDRNTQLKREDASYKLQMKHSDEDFNLSRQRTQEAYTRSLQRSVKDQAKAIYDPMQIMYSEYTTDAGTLLQNLIDQNGKIAGQTANLAKAKKMGLSQDSIDTLNLADPAQAQNLERQVQDLKDYPELVSKINAQVKERLKDTKALTQNPANEGFRRASEDFKRQSDQTESDYKKMIKRTQDAHDLGLKNMGEDYAKQITRSKEDLARMSEEVFGDFATMMGRAVSAIKKNLGPLGAAVSAELDAIAKNNPEFFMTGQQLAGAAPSGDLSSMYPSSIIDSNFSQQQASGTYGQGSDASISMSQVRSMGTVSSSPSAGWGTSTTQVDQSNRFEGPITVQAQDPDAMAKALAAQARVKKLTRPK